jgi:hypothetical protein
MKTDEITVMWQEDVYINRDNLIMESLKVPQLHSKYYNILIMEQKLLRTMEQKVEQFEYKKWLYYQGKLDKSDLDELGWKQCDLKFLKTDVQKVVGADEDVGRYRIQLSLQKDKVKFLESILDSIVKRSFLLGHAIEMHKLEYGVV